MTDQKKHTHTNLSPGMSEHTADMLAEKQKEAESKSAQKNYPVEDKRKEARQEHTNGSTPRRDQ